KLCADKGVRVLDHAVNLGIGGSVQTGYRYAYDNGYETAVQIDGDGQHDPAYLDMMYDTLVSTGADMVIGSRFIDKEGYQSTGLRRIGISFFTFLIRTLTGHVITDPTSGLRMAGSRLIREFASDYPQDYPEPESVVRAVLKGYKVVEVPVKMRERSGGVSSIHARASVYYMIKVTMAVILERMRKNEHKA
ncbi:MAG: glycosyltransferase family 2 protein, partial [Lachnospiraceae bacterium]|nr:glycosyltransferase family 2 protein [Lachnospiraceae bacterium]